MKKLEQVPAKLLVALLYHANESLSGSCVLDNGFLSGPKGQLPDAAQLRGQMLKELKRAKDELHKRKRHWRGSREVRG